MIDPYDNPEKRPHPAKFSNVLLDIIAPLVADRDWIVDPMAGVGKITLLKDRGFIGRIHCNELEQEWASQIVNADSVRCGDAFEYVIPETQGLGAIVTSPPYGNRMYQNFHSESKKKYERAIRGRSRKIFELQFSCRVAIFKHLPKDDGANLFFANCSTF